jgi:hypothetical protein
MQDRHIQVGHRLAARLSVVADQREQVEGGVRGGTVGVLQRRPVRLQQQGTQRVHRAIVHAHPTPAP